MGLLSDDVGGEVVVDIGQAVVDTATEAGVGEVASPAIVGQGTAGDVEDGADLTGFEPFAIDHDGFVELLFDGVDLLFQFEEKFLFGGDSVSSHFFCF